MAPLHWIVDRVEAQRGHMFPWVPVALAVGIGIYFTLPVEPILPVYALCAMAAAALGTLALRLGPRFSPFVLVPALVLAGRGFALQA